MPPLQRGQLVCYRSEFVDAEAKLFPVAPGGFVSLQDVHPVTLT